jgi:hypothetical protein
MEYILQLICCYSGCLVFLRWNWIADGSRLRASFRPRFPLQQFMKRTLIIAVLLLACPLLAQIPGNLYTPEIHLGSATEPSTITVPPVIEVPSAGAPSGEVPTTPPEAAVSNAPPANTSLLATRHFDFIVSPVAPTPSTRGNMADTSISLGEYARKLRAEKQRAPTQPNAIASPDNSSPSNSLPSNSLPSNSK